MATKIFANEADEKKAIASATKRVAALALPQGQTMESFLKDRKHVDFAQMTLPVGTVIKMPELSEVQERVFQEAYGVVVLCPCKEGTTTGVKKVFLSAFGREVAEYNQDGTPTGHTVASEPTTAPAAAKNVFAKCKDATSDYEVLEILAGKQLKVAEVKKATVLRYNSAGQVIGTRERAIPCFVIE